MGKKYDLVVKVGEYTNKDGEQKANWLNIGAVMEGENGPFILLNRTFNPAGMPNPENRNNILVSMFSKKDDGRSAPPITSSPSEFSGDDDIPF